MHRISAMIGTVLTLGMMLFMSTGAFAVDSTVLQNPSAQDIVNALSGGGPAVKMRGIAPPATKTGQPAAPAQAATAQAHPSASLNVDFAYNSSQLTPAAEHTLAELGKALKSEQLSRANFSIVGHTDAKGNPSYNQKLSERRAAAVKNYLVKHGIASRRLETRGVGQEALLDPANPTSEVNRRVEIINLGATSS
jgi:outer membrane protein OmpA-like peptidoglycan-associated protein